MSDAAKLRVQTVVPNETGWGTFMELNCVYFAESWPDFSASDDFAKTYESELLTRYAEGGRGFFLFHLEDEVVGLANVYMAESCLHIAEFYISPMFRRRGFGRQGYCALLNWARQRDAKAVSVEVDADISANLFWASLGLTFLRGASRNIYKGPVYPIYLVWIRHGECEAPAVTGGRVGRLTEAAQSQARRIGKALEALGGLTLFTSPLERTIETASAISQGMATEVELIQVPELSEFVPRRAAELSTAARPSAYRELTREWSDLLDQAADERGIAVNRALQALDRIARLQMLSNIRFLVGHGTLHSLVVLSRLNAPVQNAFAIRIGYLRVSILSYDMLESTFAIEMLNSSAVGGLVDAVSRDQSLSLRNATAVKNSLLTLGLPKT